MKFHLMALTRKPDFSDLSQVQRGLALAPFTSVLGEHREGDIVFRAAEAGDFGVGCGFLVGELVAGEAEDGKAVRAIGFLEFFEAIILRGEAAFAGGVDDEQDAAAVIGQGYFSAVDTGGR